MWYGLTHHIQRQSHYDIKEEYVKTAERRIKKYNQQQLSIPLFELITS